MHLRRVEWEEEKDRASPKIVEYEFNAFTGLITTAKHSDNAYAMHICLLIGTGYDSKEIPFSKLIHTADISCFGSFLFFATLTSFSF